MEKKTSRNASLEEIKPVKSVKIEKEKKNEKKPETLKLNDEKDIALDFATKVYQKFDKMIKSLILFGSSIKNNSSPESDIDIISIIDDVSIQWDPELISWYREELGKLVQANPYKKSLHINTVKLSTWWADLLRGDPIVVNVIRNGEALIDFGGFYSPLKVLLAEGKIKSTPEAIYTLLQRAPTHMMRTREAMLAAIDGLYWAMVDSAHAALIAAKVSPASPEHVPVILKETFVDKKILNMDYVINYRDMHALAKDIIHGKTVTVNGKDIDAWIVKTDEFVGEMAKLVNMMLPEKS